MSKLRHPIICNVCLIDSCSGSHLIVPRLARVRRSCVVKVGRLLFGWDNKADTLYNGHNWRSPCIQCPSEQRLHVTCRDTPQLPGLLLEHPPHEDDRSKVELLLCVCLRPPRSWSSVMSTSAAWSHHSHTAEPALTGCELQVPLLYCGQCSHCQPSVAPQQYHLYLYHHYYTLSLHSSFSVTDTDRT